METPIKVSICVPVYNVKDYIRRCAVSLFGQTYADIEYVFVDDCTPDSSIDVLEEILEEYPKRKDDVNIVHHTQNRGVAAARNTAIDHSHGEFIMWVDPDDYIEPNTVEKVVSFWKKNGGDIISFDTCIHFETYNKIWEQPQFASAAEMAIKVIKREVPVPLWGRLIKRDLFQTYNIRAEEGVNIHEDYQMLAMLAFHAEKVATFNAVLYHYDRTNEKAATYVYNLPQSKMEQTWRSFSSIKSFFQKKGCIYNEAVEWAEVIFVYEAMIACARNPSNDDYFKEVVLVRLKHTNHAFWKVLPFPKKIVLYIHNIKLLRVYLSIIDCFRNIYHKI